MRRLPALSNILASSLLAVLFATGCASRNFDQPITRYHEDGRAKPIVAIPVMIDTTSFDASWSIAEELTESIAQSISRTGQIYMQSQDNFSISDNPFGHDLSWVKQDFENQEFAVFLELVEHELVPAKKSKNLSPREMAANLNMGVRIRIVDLRGHSEKVILQELVRESYYVPKSLVPIDYQTVSWGTEEYRKSPMGVAHSRIAQEIASRVSDYILLAKSR